MEHLRTVRNSPFAVAPAHRRFLSASADWRVHVAWLALPHYHLADLTPRLVFKMGPLTQGDFLGSVTCLALQGVAITLTGLCMFRTRS
jgi:hypothetical protein